ncbi:MAG: class I SAM-dependent methyltransferase [Aggregatilineales bacterium]
MPSRSECNSCPQERLSALLRLSAGEVALDVVASGQMALKRTDGEAPIRAEASHLPLQAGSLDVIALCDVAHRLDDVPRLLSECARALKTGGRLGILDPIAPEQPKAARYLNAFERLRDPSHVRLHCLADWRAMLRAAELEITHSEVSTARLDLYAWARLLHNDAQTVLRLRVLLHQAPQAVRAFLKPTFYADGSGDIAFERHCGIFIARKAR